MERYDGKTKRDDYIKYALIAAGIIVIIVLYKFITWGIYTISHPSPDITVVVACELALDFDIQNSLEESLEVALPDIDGNGKTVVEVLTLRTEENEEITRNELDKAGAKTDIDLLREYISEGPYTLFLLIDAKKNFFVGDSYVNEPPHITYCNSRYCQELPEDLRNTDSSYYIDLTGCSATRSIGWENIPFYGCIRKGSTEEEANLAISILRMMKAQA